MQVPERDSTRDWVLPDGARPPLVSELVARIDEALATARASEAAVITIGDAALEAAEQARRAAELAERASATMSGPGEAPPPAHAPAPVASDPGTEHRPLSDSDASLRDFSARADRLAERLKQLQKRPEIPPVWGGPPPDRVTRG
jgi:hypothetical protein